MKRTFIVFTEPTVADPSLFVPVVEVDENGGHTYWSNANKLIEVATQVNDYIKRQEIQLQTRMETLKILGITTEEYTSKVFQYYEKHK